MKSLNIKTITILYLTWFQTVASDIFLNAYDMRAILY